MKKVETRLIDDTDGSDADESVHFGLDGHDYQIDLTSENAAELRDRLEVFVSHAQRKTANSAAVKSSSKSRAARADTAAIRAWASQNGYEVSERGRIPNSIMEAYRVAGN